MTFEGQNRAEAPYWMRSMFAGHPSLAPAYFRQFAEAEENRNKAILRRARAEGRPVTVHVVAGSSASTQQP